MPQKLGYRQLWSEDRNTLTQIFSDLDTDSIVLVTVHRRADPGSAWESVHKAEPTH